jgi:2'-5' RNA ligase
MRLFVGVEVGPEVIKSGGELIDELRKRVAAQAPLARVTWVVPDRLHVTVRFIGAADDARAAAIRTALQSQLHSRAFTLTVKGVGAFPGRGAPRVFWAGLTAGQDGLLDVEREVSDRLERLLPREDPPYAPHLTLGRVKDPRGLGKVALFEGLADVVLGHARVDAITLFESLPSSKGPTYVPLQRTALA